MWFALTSGVIGIVFTISFLEYYPEKGIDHLPAKAKKAFDMIKTLGFALIPGLVINVIFLFLQWWSL